MRPGRDVNEIVLGVGIERKAARKVEQLSIHFLKVPGVVEVELMRDDFGLWRDVVDVLCDDFSEAAVIAAVKKDEAIDAQVFLHADADARPPFVPASGIELPRIERRTEKSNDCYGVHAVLYKFII